MRDPSNLSAPIVKRPIHECAAAVRVSSFVPGATVRVYANGSELIGQETSLVGFLEVRLTRHLVLGDVVTAKQTVGLVTSAASYDPVGIEPYPALTRPVVSPDLYVCGRVVLVGNLVSSTHVEVSDVTAHLPLGAAEATGEWEPVVTVGLLRGHQTQAIQIACPHVPAKTASSPPSHQVKVRPEPAPLPLVGVDKPVVGTDVVTLHNTLVGAEVEIKNGSTTIGNGLATARVSWARVSPRIPAGASASITATQKLCSRSLPSDPVHPTGSLPAPKLGAPICAGSRLVTVDGTVLNANVVLIRRGHIIGYGGAVPGTLQLTVGKDVTLMSGDVLIAVQYIGNVISTTSNPVTVGCDWGSDVVTQHNDNFRTGAYLFEKTLTPAKVLARGMREKYKHPLDGPVAAQPLFVRNVPFPSGSANGVFVATMANKVYGLNADTGAEKWVTALTDREPRKRKLARGVSSTPVIDVPNHRLYVLFSTKNQPLDTANCPDSTHPRPECGSYEDQLAGLDVAYWLVALDYRTGAEVGRVQVAASLFRSDGTPVRFISKNHNDRPGILLDHGWLYVAFGMRHREGISEYHGWIIRYRTPHLTYDGAFCTSRDATVPTTPFTQHKADGAGVWQGGGGLASDPDGNVYFLTGNARADHAHYMYGNSLVRLTPTEEALVPTAFVPSRPLGSTDPNDPDDPDVLDANDADLGAGGALTIPGFDLVIGGGKTGLMYLLDRRTMKLVQKITAATNQIDPTLRAQSWDAGPHLHGSPTLWRGPKNLAHLYVWGEKDVLRQYRFDAVTGRFHEPALHHGTKTGPDAMPGGMISLSANGDAAGTGIVWATLPASDRMAPGVNAHPGHLYAFDAESLRPLWDIDFSSLGKWLPPTIANGTVFIGTYSNELIAYELGPRQHAAALVWTPYQAQESPNPVPLSERYDDEASIHARATIALTQLAPPPRHALSLVLEGDGEHYYETGEATEEHGKLVWEWKASTADLSLAGAGPPNEQHRIPAVRLSLGHVWSASDGSTAASEVVNVAPAPGKTDSRWLLYRVTDTAGAGILKGIRYIQCVFTIGGLPSSQPPHRRTDVLRVPYHGQYLLFTSKRATHTAEE